MKYLKFFSGKAVKPSTLSSIIHFKLKKAKKIQKAKKIKIPRGKTFTKSFKIWKIDEGLFSTEFLYFKYFMFIVPKSKWIQKLVFIVFFACEQNLRVSLIGGKELEVFLFLFNWSFICHFMICVNVRLGIFKENWPGF